MRTLERFAVARRAHGLTLRLYSTTAAFPREERYGLASQMRRASASIGSNIAEGDAGRSNAEFARYLEVAIASTGEVAYQLLLARDLGYFDSATYDSLAEEAAGVRAMLIALARSVRARQPVKLHPDR